MKADSTLLYPWRSQDHPLRTWEWSQFKTTPDDVIENVELWLWNKQVEWNCNVPSIRMGNGDQECVLAAPIQALLSQKSVTDWCKQHRRRGSTKHRWPKIKHDSGKGRQNTLLMLPEQRQSNRVSHLSRLGPS